MQSQVEGAVLERDRGRRRGPRPVVAALILLAVYGLATLALDPHGVVMSDVGTKTSTLRVMDDRDTWVPGVGYWAEAEDPDGSLHPLVFTERFGDEWVTVTTLPMLMVVHPLWDLGGMRLALLVPIAGAIACAFAARALARRLGSRSPDIAFWVVGFGSPVVFYALELWEHTPGLACMLWAVVLALDTFDAERSGVAAPLAAGALFGLAATMRTEAFVYLAATTAVLFFATAPRSRFGERVRRAALVGAGAAGALLAGLLLEIALIGAPLRSGRTSAAAGSAASDFGIPIEQIVVTTLGVGTSRPALSFFFGGVFVALVVAAMVGISRNWPHDRVVKLCVFAGAVMLVRFGLGFSFVNGVFTAFPVAIAGIVLAWRNERTRMVALVALVAMPLVWLTEYSNAPWQQWGGRYLLTSAILLGVVGVVELERRSRPALVAVVGLTALVSLYCFAYLVYGSHDSADFARAIDSRTEDLVVTPYSGLMRFAGEYYSPTRPWFTIDSDAELREALAIAEVRGMQRVAVIGPDAQPEVDGWIQTAVEPALKGNTATIYERSP